MNCCFHEIGGVGIGWRAIATFASNIRLIRIIHGPVECIPAYLIFVTWGEDIGLNHSGQMLMNGLPGQGSVQESGETSAVGAIVLAH
jgi:hypothetical protein